MNGCDHQPKQVEAIRVANELFPDVTFIHSSLLMNMFKNVESALPEQLSTVTGRIGPVKPMVGTRWQIRLPLSLSQQAFQENSSTWSKWWNL